MPDTRRTADGPRHVAIIMDGNGRWATRQGRPRLFGHRAGAERVRDIVEACPGLGIRWLTLFAFSTENWKRTTEEVAGLMAIFRRYIRSEAPRLKAQGARVRFIGDRGPLDAKLRGLMDWLEAETAGNGRINVTVALNYGGRDELLRAARRAVAAAAAGALAPEDLDADGFAGFLDTGGMPDPDLVIRTSGEMRVSNFLLWQAAYAEFAFTPTLWPDFTPEELERHVADFARRERRFGAVPAPADADLP